MTNVKQLIEYLQILPGDTTVNVVQTRDAGDQGYYSTFEPLVIGENTEYLGIEYRNIPELYLGET